MCPNEPLRVPCIQAGDGQEVDQHAVKFHMNINQTTKRFLWAGGWVLSVLAAFAIGLWVASYSFGMFVSTNYLSRELVEAIQTQHYLEFLDNGVPEKARQSLNLRMDGHILTVASLSEYTGSEKDRETANKFLRRVAEHRKKHKPTYPDGISSGEMREVEAMIAEILKSRESIK